ncbi:uncharacterized protein LOC130654118 [Hydractinia symbiolongicarpus]|uniref:uncharacterized protein LOC130654118 n=1 Tax=Hydractinia symbiolongicarpus TaxID=13093 RepID=UPI00254C43DE|nr:uncharacterized protein LOC130654118 [Hydractinia symbiolongicarpus]
MQALCQLLIVVAIVIVNVQAWDLKSTNDSCYEERGGLFPCSDTITGNVILMVFYGAVLGVAAKFISDGAELLLDLGFAPSIIGGVVLPILGAVPDSAIIVASGLGDDAQEKLSVGMGTLAGSTVMLLTVAWSASLFIGKCNLNNQGVSVDGSGKGKFSMTKQGITPLPEVKSGIVIMLATSTFYFVVQSADWHWGATKTVGQPAYVRDAALATLVICIIGLIAYIVYSIFDSKRTDRIAKLHREEMVKRQVLHTLLLLADRQSFKPKSPQLDSPDTAKPEEEEQAVSKKYFKAWHMKKGMRGMREKLDSDEGNEPLIGNNEQTNLEVKEDPAEHEGEESKSKIAIKCAGMLFTGVALVTLFSDPMCDVLTALTNKNNKSYIPIPPFYVSFVVTPFCSNASELVSSLIFASKKTRETATMTFSQIFGAATMNNTMCLAIFMALVYAKDLEWYYGAEVMCIVLVQWMVGLISLSKTYKVWMGIPVVVMYLVCVLLVYLLEYVADWK